MVWSDGLTIKSDIIDLKVISSVKVVGTGGQPLSIPEYNVINSS